MTIMFEVLKFQHGRLTAWAIDRALRNARDCNTDITVLPGSRPGTKGKCIDVAFMMVQANMMIF